MKLYETIYFNKYKQTTIRLSENSLFKNLILGRKDFTERISSLLPGKHLRTEFKILQKKLGITTLYVTHNFYEAEEMAQRIAVFDRGRVEQIGLSKEIFFHPTEVVNDFIGAPNILTCDYCNRLSFGLVEVKCGDISLVVSSEREEIKKVAILPEDIYLSDTKPPGPDVNRVKGRLIGIEESSSTVCCTIVCAQQRAYQVG